MNLSKQQIHENIAVWLKAWDQHNLDGVMELMHEHVVFEHWTGETITGKQSLRRAWTPWFLQHGNFVFIVEDIFVDEQAQKALFRWRLEWPSLEPKYKNKAEIRRGVDVLHFQDGKIREKLTYSKNFLVIDGNRISLET
jgi:ketosteroid isomerase-like protein